MFSRDVDISSSLDAPRLLLANGGRRPDPSWIADFVSSNRFDVWGVDSGISSCVAAGVKVSRAIGDMDSVARGDLRSSLSNGASEYLYCRDKDMTDLQIALDMSGSDPVAVTGCFGGRADHLISAIDTLGGAVASRAKRGMCCMIDDAEGIVFVESATTTLYFKREIKALSLLCVTDECDGVDIDGVKWRMSGARLERSRQWAVSNEIAGADGVVNVTCARGVLAVYWCIRENGL